ncbi:L-cystine transporter-like protein, partial [Pseudovirgaria hyperparasitica]
MSDSELRLFAQAVSRVLGWIYFVSWSFSFYPQPILNWQRKTTSGFAIDYPTLNILGFTSYTISTASFLYNPTIRQQYAYRNPLEPIPTVRFNDFLFALHGAIMCLVAYSQFFPRLWGFKESDRQKASRVAVGIVIGCLAGVGIVIAIVLIKGKDFGEDPSGWAWIEVMYAISYVKLIATVVKYVPQCYMNFRRKSTVGFHMAGIWADFIGGVLSIGQLLIDASLESDWSGITGNPAKFLLANITIVFDLVFLVQHLVLY